MTQQAYEQTVKQQEHIEDLLTIESYKKWYKSLSQDKYIDILQGDLSFKSAYLKEHGLPLTSEIKGL